MRAPRRPRLLRRPHSLAIQRGELIDIGDPTFGLNPAPEPLLGLWNAGSLAIAHAAGHTGNDSRSHFEKMRVVETGGSGTGFLDRYCQVRAERTVCSSVALENSLPTSLDGPSSDRVLGRNGVENFRLRGPEPDEPARVIRTMYDPLDHPATTQIASTMSALDTARMLADAGYQPADGAQYPDGPLGPHHTWPGLADAEPGELASVIHDRQVLGEWMTTHGGVGSVAEVFPQFDHAPLGFTT